MSVLIKGITKSDFESILTEARYGANNCMIGEYAEVVEIPPHGRLIDADALIETNAELADCDFIHPRIGSTLREVVEDAPTIIDAEE